MNKIEQAREALATVCPDCDGNGLMHGYDADCPTCKAAGTVPLRSHVGRSTANDCWWVRFYPAATEAHAKALEERIREAFSPSTPVDGVVVAEFGEGKLVVDTGTSYGKPAVFIAPAKIPGEVGSSAKRENNPLDRLSPGEFFMTFPTMEQAERVADALVNASPSEARLAQAVRAPAVTDQMVRRMATNIMRQAGLEDYMVSDPKLAPTYTFCGVDLRQALEAALQQSAGEGQ